MAEVTDEQPIPAGIVMPEAKKSRAGLWIGLTAIVMTLALAAAGFYFMQQLRATQDTENNQDNLKLIEIDKSLNGLQSQVSGLQTQIANLNAEMTGKDNHFTQTLADFSQMHNERLDSARKELETSIMGLQRQLGKTRGDWLIADAEYLLSVANQRLHLVGDIATTREALEAADQRLRESGDAAVFKVREQIAKEIAGLSGISEPDIVGLYATVQQLQDRVESLSVLLPHAGKEPPKPEQQQSHIHLSQQGHDLLESLSKQLEGYVVLRHTQQSIDSILTPEEAHFIKQQLKVRLEMIQIALVQQNDTLYKTSVADVKQWLSKNFAEGRDTELFAADLEKLANTQIRSQYPDISGSLKLLKDISKLRIETDKAALTATKPHVQPNLGVASDKDASIPPYVPQTTAPTQP